MARDHHRLSTTIWDEPSIRSLTRLQQQAYLLVLSQGDLSRCGVLAYRPRRWAKTSTDATEKALRRDYNSLANTRHVVIDDDSEELFARTYMRHDHVLASPNVVAAVVSDYQLIAGEQIRSAVLTELRRLWSLPDLPAGERAGWLLAMGHFPAAAEDGAKGDWPNTMTPAALTRIRKAIKTGLRQQMHAAIQAETVEPFSEGSPEGIPAPFAEPSVEGFTEPPGGRRGGARSTIHQPSPPSTNHQPPATTRDPDALTNPSTVVTLLDRTGPYVGTVRDRLAAHADAALTDGIPPDPIEAALRDWQTRPGAAPGLLPDLIQDQLRRANGTKPSRRSASEAAAQAALDAGARVAARHAAREASA